MVTIGITYYNAEDTFDTMYKSAVNQRFPIIIADNGSEKPLANAIPVPHDGSKTKRQNMVAARRALIDLTTTPYHFILDDDVILPDNAVSECLKFFESTPNCGCVGLARDDFNLHVVSGSTLWKTAVLKMLTFDNYKKQCYCQMAFEQLARMGLSMINHPTLKAIHLRRGYGYQ